MQYAKLAAPLIRFIYGVKNNNNNRKDIPTIHRFSFILTHHSENLTDLQMAHRTLVGNLHLLWDNGHTFCFWKLTY